jgi:hypothetical protein
MKDSAFKPQYVTARLGQTLVFMNDDAVAHKIKRQEGQYYSSGTLSHGQTYEYRTKQDPQLQNMAFILHDSPRNDARRGRRHEVVRRVFGPSNLRGGPGLRSFFALGSRWCQ